MKLRSDWSASKFSETRELLPRQYPSAVGTRPDGAGDEGEAALRVREMFGAIARRYDLLNHLLSFSCDLFWRRIAARRVRGVLRSGGRALDVCCGTGDLTFAMEREARRRSEIVGADFVQPMLACAQEKAGRSASRARFVSADALNLPFGDATFDLVAIAFGLRNLANYACGIAELRRVLRPGGTLAILEFTQPRAAFFGRVYGFYFKDILPFVGGALSGSGKAYGYLPVSVARFPSPENLGEKLLSTGFTRVRFELWAHGIVSFHLAQRS